MAAHPANGSAVVQRWLIILGGILALVAPILGGGWWLSNLNGRVATIESGQPKDAATSEAQIADLQRRMDRRDVQIQNVEISGSQMCRQLAAVEIQVGAILSALNQVKEGDEKRFALLWEKVYGTHAPDSTIAIDIPHETMPCMR